MNDITDMVWAQRLQNNSVTADVGCHDRLAFGT